MFLDIFLLSWLCSVRSTLREIESISLNHIRNGSFSSDPGLVTVMYLQLWLRTTDGVLGCVSVRDTLSTQYPLTTKWLLSWANTTWRQVRYYVPSPPPPPPPPLDWSVTTTVTALELHTFTPLYQDWVRTENWEPNWETWNVYTICLVRPGLGKVLSCPKRRKLSSLVPSSHVPTALSVAKYLSISGEKRKRNSAVQF